MEIPMLGSEKKLECIWPNLSYVAPFWRCSDILHICTCQLEMIGL